MATAHGKDQCDVEFDADLEIGPERIVIADRRLGEVVIGDGGSLAIDGRDVSVDADQREAVQAYAAQLREVVPQVVDVALMGVEIGMTAVAEVFAGITGGDVPDAVRESVAEARREVAERVGKEGEVWYVRDEGLSDVGDAMKTIEPAIEEAVSASIGALLIAVGQSMTSGDGTMDEEIRSFSERMERMGEDIETRVEAQAEQIERQAEALCDEVQLLADREEALREQVPELAGLRVLENS